MSRTTVAVARHRKHKRVLEATKGFRGRSSKCYRIAVQALRKSWVYSYVGRKVKKRDYRSLFIQRINGEVRQHGLSYSRFMNGLKVQGIELNRKILARLAFDNKEAFKAIVDKVKSSMSDIKNTVRTSAAA